MTRKRVSFLKAYQLKKRGYFKLPKHGHKWVGTGFVWARICVNNYIMVYSEKYLANHTLQELQDAALKFDLRFIKEELKTESLTEEDLESVMPQKRFERYKQS